MDDFRQHLFVFESIARRRSFGFPGRVSRFVRRRRRLGGRCSCVPSSGSFAHALFAISAAALYLVTTSGFVFDRPSIAIDAFAWVSSRGLGQPSSLSLSLSSFPPFLSLRARVDPRHGAWSFDGLLVSCSCFVPRTDRSPPRLRIRNRTWWRRCRWEGGWVSTSISPLCPLSIPFPSLPKPRGRREAGKRIHQPRCLVLPGSGMVGLDPTQTRIPFPTLEDAGQKEWKPGE